jgi:hypothetical protein
MEEHSLRHLISPLLELHALITRVQGQLYILTQLHQNIPEFLPECKDSIARAVQAHQRTLQHLTSHQG